jgi:hypothetical protein
MPPRNPIEAVAPPVREVFYKEGVGVVATGIQEGPGGMPVGALQLQTAHGTNDRWYHSFVIADDPSTDALIDHLIRHSGG